MAAIGPGGAIVYLNGEWVPLSEARVSVLDRGFIFGDGVYEVIPAFAGRLFRPDQHLQRLDNSLMAVRMKNPLTRERWRAVLNTLLERNGGGDQSVYLQITRGVARRDHVLPEPVPPTVFAMSSPAVRQNRQPVTAIVCEDIRWKWCQIKSTALLANVLMRLAAQEHGAYEALLIRDGWLTEGAASNVFIVTDGIVKTPPHSENLLPGITRDLIVELLAAHRIPHAETAVGEAELRAADEIFLTSSVREVVPVVKLDDKPVGAGVPGPVWERVVALYEQFRNAEVARIKTGAAA
ncbi:MAG TPA: D-amino acid aminotransferase [Gammaproteobacteria bacterium]|nr:D-amino acid aminotransferase [Gammaproteobacteria bacterium]